MMQSDDAGTAVPLGSELSLWELSRCCRCSTEWVIELVAEGVIEPLGGASPDAWIFDETAVGRAGAAWRLARDLSVNAAGAALALELLDEISALRRQLRFRPLD
ncbi:MAG TPA: chaperone modulator CbpM [Burkholderiaceae bacterium]|nr:chaperone modulator CbpM [Burkholderiaceae bacterium]